MSWAETFVSAVYLLSPLVIGGVVHMVVVKFGWVGFMARPINPAAFGRNKTWRGLVVMPLATVLGVQITRALEDIGIFGIAKDKSNCSISD